MVTRFQDPDLSFLSKATSTTVGILQEMITDGLFPLDGSETAECVQSVPLQIKGLYLQSGLIFHKE